MDNISQILCVIDPTTTAQPAMERAAWLAAHTDARLELFICYYNEYLSGERLFDSPSLERARKDIVKGHEKRLEAMVEPLRKRGLGVTTTVLWDHPLHEGIVRHAAAVGADVVFKDTHHHSAVSRALLSNTDWNLIRSCAAPLWLVKPGGIPEHPTFVAAIDPMHEHDKPGELDDEILETSMMLAKATGAQFKAFHAYDPRMAIATANASAYIPVSFPFAELEKQMYAEHKKRFDEIAKKHGVDEDDLHLAAGLTHEELPDFCRSIGAAVVVMGAVSRNRLQRLFIGATAERTLEYLPCDLLIVKPDWFQIPVEISGNRAA